MKYAAPHPNHCYACPIVTIDNGLFISVLQVYLIFRMQLCIIMLYILYCKQLYLLLSGQQQPIQIHEAGVHHYRQEAGVPIVPHWTMDPDDVSIFRSIVCVVLEWTQLDGMFQKYPDVSLLTRLDVFGRECTSVCLFLNKAALYKADAEQARPLSRDQTSKVKSLLFSLVAANVPTSHLTYR